MKNLNHNFLVKSATYAAIAVAAILIIAKFIAWRLTDSLSVQASLIDSLLDGAASFFNFILVRQALKPADAAHRFGHGKIEALAGLAQSIFIASSALWLLVETSHRFIHPTPLVSSSVATLIMICATALTAILVAWQRYVIHHTKSIAIEADCLHYYGDFLSDIAVLISLNLSFRFGWYRLDSMLATLIAGYILYTSWKIAIASIDILMDREFPEQDRQRIKKIVLQNPRVIKINDLRTRSSGQKDFIQMHLELESDLPLVKAHQISEEVSKEIHKLFSRAEIIIHQKPYTPIQTEETKK